VTEAETQTAQALTPAQAVCAKLRAKARTGEDIRVTFLRSLLP
jgi:hypothetical protein